jgi:hypothetical protein
VGDGFGVEVPALAALGHPQPPGLICTRAAVVFSGGSAGHGNDVEAAGGGVDAAHRQRPDAHAVLLGQHLGDLGAQGQFGALGPGHLPGIHSRGVGGGHQALTSTSVVVACWSLASGMVVVSGVRSAALLEEIVCGPSETRTAGEGAQS